MQVKQQRVKLVIRERLEHNVVDFDEFSFGVKDDEGKADILAFTRTINDTNFNASLGLLGTEW